MNMIKFLATTTLIFLFASGTVLAEETVTVVVKDYKFDPEEITVKVGTTIRWENQEEGQYHSILFPAMDDKKVDYFFPGDSRERTFDKPGTYPYICEPHIESHNMKGVVHVVE
ncbi:MAG TPA: plastocyanin [Chromatiales bacterium]|nr:plastocyanin [Thiotrichales bacterium]HIP69257.1 plastocyanin [Chromatiales bacterium]